MTQIIVRAFASAAQAEQAVEALLFQRIARQHISIVAPPASAGARGEPDEASLKMLIAALQKAKLRTARAQVLARRIAQGDTVICVAAPFGQAIAAIDALDSAGPLDLGVPETGERYFAAGEVAAVISELFSLPVLAGSGSAMSSLLGLPTLIPKGKPLGFGFLLGTRAKAYTGFLGLPLLSGGASPYKSFLGLPPLSAAKAPYKGFLGLPLLTGSSQRRVQR